MRAEVIDNQGRVTMHQEFEAHLESCRIAKLATASLTLSAVEMIERALRKRKGNLSIQMLIGLQNGYTESKALSRLLSLRRRSAGALDVRLARNPRFHWKTYLYLWDTKAIAFVGSSNLTADGLSVEGELNLRLVARARDQVIRELRRRFDDRFESDASVLTEEIAREYKPAAIRNRQLTKTLNPVINQVFRAVAREARDRKVKKHHAATKTWTAVEERIRRSVERYVSSATNWDKHGWHWMVCATSAERDKLRDAKSFYLADCYGSRIWLSLNDVRAYQDMKTEDGRFFLAYSQRPRTICKYVDGRTRQLLVSGGLIRKLNDLRRGRQLRDEHRVLLNRLLRTRQD